MYLSINNVEVSFKNTSVLADFNLNVNEGSIYSIIGPSGCGKSTLLKSICGIIRPIKGEILIKGEKADPQKHTFGYIPQHYGLLDWLKVKDNLSLGYKIRKTKASHEERIIEQLEIGNLLNRYPTELSGGQKQRVALARSWMLQPDLLLMDEPFSSLDNFTAEKSYDLFIKLWKEHRTTTLFVTHNVKEAVRMGKFIILLSEQPAKVVKIIENPLFNPGSSRTADDFFHFEQEVNKQIFFIRAKKQ